MRARPLPNRWGWKTKCSAWTKTDARGLLLRTSRLDRLAARRYRDQQPNDPVAARQAGVPFLPNGAPSSQLCDNVAEDVSVVAADLRQDALDPSQCVSRWRVRPEPSAFAVLQMCAIGTEHALLHVYVVVAPEKPPNRIHCAVSPACSACWNCQSSLLHVLVSAVFAHAYTPSCRRAVACR